jgi:hypothetical protein
MKKIRAKRARARQRERRGETDLRPHYRESDLSAKLLNHNNLFCRSCYAPESGCSSAQRFDEL